MEHLTPEHIESVDAHVDEHLANLTASDQKLFNICDVYKAIRPVLKVVRALLFWKPKWQNVLDIFITTMDENCPQV